MTRITIVTKLRLAAAIAPVVLLIAAPIIAMALYLFGALPALLQENEYAAMRAADGMETAIYKMDWGRTQPEGMEIVRGQERRFAGWVDTARAHATTHDQLDQLDKIAQTANPIFDALRQANPADDSIEPKLRDLQGLVVDLIATDESAIMGIGAVTESRARLLIGLLLIAGVLVPWAAFVVLTRMAGQVKTSLREIRNRVQKMAAGPAGQSEDLRMIDEKLTELGFPKP
ncbi:MAG TPA: hypothetical protein VJX23_16965, partial [Candidatus Binataceae bacterium]|nr:hypothetical protein [Candidatus Binataceae bacterium]